MTFQSIESKLKHPSNQLNQQRVQHISTLFIWLDSRSFSLRLRPCARTLWVLWRKAKSSPCGTCRPTRSSSISTSNSKWLWNFGWDTQTNTNGRQWPALAGNGQQWSAMVRNSTVIVRKFQARNHCRGNHSAFWSPSAHESEELAAQTLRVPGPSRLSNNQGQKAHVSSPDGTGTSELCTVQWRETPQMASEDVWRCLKIGYPMGTPWYPQSQWIPMDHHWGNSWNSKAKHN